MPYLTRKDVAYYSTRYYATIEYKYPRVTQWRIARGPQFILIAPHCDELPFWFEEFDKGVRTHSYYDWRLQLVPAHEAAPCPT